MKEKHIRYGIRYWALTLLPFLLSLAANPTKSTELDQVPKPVFTVIEPLDDNSAPVTFTQSGFTIPDTAPCFPGDFDTELTTIDGKEMHPFPPACEFDDTGYVPVTNSRLTFAKITFEGLNTIDRSGFALQFNAQSVQQLRDYLTELGLDPNTEITIDLNDTSYESYACLGGTDSYSMRSSGNGENYFVKGRLKTLMLIVYQMGYQREDFNDPAVQTEFTNRLAWFLQQWITHESGHAVHAQNGTESDQAESEATAFELRYPTQPIFRIVSAFDSSLFTPRPEDGREARYQIVDAAIRFREAASYELNHDADTVFVDVDFDAILEGFLKDERERYEVYRGEVAHDGRARAVCPVINNTNSLFNPNSPNVKLNR